jgi:hypothetical protein
MANYTAILNKSTTEENIEEHLLSDSAEEETSSRKS